MTRTPDEIKKGLECCVIGPSAHQPKCGECPYMFVPMCSDTFLKDALALIQQLEAQNTELLKKVEQLQAERDAAIHDMPTSCMLCKHFQKKYNTCNSKKPCACISGVKTEWEWRGVQKEDGNASD